MKSQNRYNSTDIPPYAEKLVKITALKIVQKKLFPHSELDSLEQDLMLHLLQCLPKHDPEKSSINSFMVMVVQRKAWHIIGKEKRRSCRFIQDSFDADNSNAIKHDLSEADYCEYFGHPFTEHVESVSNKDWVEEVLQKLDPNLRELAELLKSKSPTEIAKMKEISQSTVMYRVSVLKRHFNNFF